MPCGAPISLSNLLNNRLGQKSQIERFAQLLDNVKQLMVKNELKNWQLLEHSDQIYCCDSVVQAASIQLSRDNHVHVLNVSYEIRKQDNQFTVCVIPTLNNYIKMNKLNGSLSYVLE